MNNQIQFGASCLSRCLIYKVHTALQRREFILPHRFDLVKSFFKVFSNFFQLFRSARQASPFFVALTGDSISLPYLSSLVKNFFRTVRWFLFSHSSSLLIWKTTVSRTALIEYHRSLHLSTLSSTFFKKIFHRYRTPILRSPFDKLSP